MAIIRSAVKQELLQWSFPKYYTKFHRINEKIVQALFNVKYASAFNLFLKPWNRNVIVSLENVTTVEPPINDHP